MRGCFSTLDSGRMREKKFFSIFRRPSNNVVSGLEWRAGSDVHGRGDGAHGGRRGRARARRSWGAAWATEGWAGVLCAVTGDAEPGCRCLLF